MDLFSNIQKNIKTKLLSYHCPICGEKNRELGKHIKEKHGEEIFKDVVIAAKLEGVPDSKIGKILGISFTQLEKIITEKYGINISNLRKKKKIKQWEPKNFSLESTSVWSFRHRGNWATHDARYRGNWSPYIPRNIILRYTEPGDLVLDYFVGGGTTAVEAKLLGRRCIAKDINPAAIELTKENLKFEIPEIYKRGLKIYEPNVYVGNAMDLSEIKDKVDLICTHPPYAGIIKYSSMVEGDLSQLSEEEFYAAMTKIATESYRVLKPGGKFVLLIGDARRNKFVVPVGFEIIKRVLSTGFILRELIIKRQHNCKTTGFWYKRSIKYNFLLLSHEYLPVFEKPSQNYTERLSKVREETLPYQLNLFIDRAREIESEGLETTTVWIFRKDEVETAIRRNLLFRFCPPGQKFLEVNLNNPKNNLEDLSDFSLLYAKQPLNLKNRKELFSLFRAFEETLLKKILEDDHDKHLVFRLKDFREDGELIPSALLLWEKLRKYPIKLREIVIVVEEGDETKEIKSELKITHQYLLIYKFTGGKDVR